jgi:hypothetical protein
MPEGKRLMSHVRSNLEQLRQEWLRNFPHQSNSTMLRRFSIGGSRIGSSARPEWSQSEGPWRYGTTKWIALQLSESGGIRTPGRCDGDRNEGTRHQYAAHDCPVARTCEVDARNFGLLKVPLQACAARLRSKALNGESALAPEPA